MNKVLKRVSETMRMQDLSLKDIAFVGGKNAGLGELTQNLSAKGINVPNGFAVTVDAYKAHIHQKGIHKRIENLAEKITPTTSKEEIATISRQIRDEIESHELPNEVARAIADAYAELERQYGSNCDVALRSSAVAEDLPGSSFAGQLESLVNISGLTTILEKVPIIMSSLFTERVINYRMDRECIQKMVRSDRASAGVVFTLDPDSGSPSTIVITASYGLGEGVVSGEVTPDEYYVHKETLRRNFQSILRKVVGDKAKKLVYHERDGDRTTSIHATEWETVNENDAKKFCLTNAQILELAQYSLAIEDHYSERNGRLTPMDVEFAVDGLDGRVYIVQARPETVHSQKLLKREGQSVSIEQYVFDTPAMPTPILHGVSVGSKVASGPFRICKGLEDAKQLKQGEILVTTKTSPDWEPFMRLAGGIVTETGGRTCHAAIIGRELGLAAIVGVGTHAMETLQSTDHTLTIDCSHGATGYVYEGNIPFTVHTKNLQEVPPLPCKVCVNMSNPDEAFHVQQSLGTLIQGVGLTRIEFVIAANIQVHPLLLLAMDNSATIVNQLNPIDRERVEALTINYPVGSKARYFVDTMAQDIATIAAAFYPAPVLIRTSDFKTNEYRQLLGGELFEEEEQNPMLGYRGASRYYQGPYAPAFRLECQALWSMIHEKGMSNVQLLIPFVRTVDEGMQVLALLASEGLVGYSYHKHLQQKASDGAAHIADGNVAVYMMIEIPSNVFLFEQFYEIFDGFSIGTNDLTQLTLAVDRDAGSEFLHPLFNERSESMLRILTLLFQKRAMACETKDSKPIGVCGQAPSDYPQFLRLLVDDFHIDSISLNTDAVVPSLLAYHSQEKP